MTREPTHPGEHIAVELEEINTSATQVAKELGIPANRLTGIIRGRRGVTADTALRLAAWLGTTPEFWMHLQRNYDLKTAKREPGEEIRHTVRRHNAGARPGDHSPGPPGQDRIRAPRPGG